MLKLVIVESPAKANTIKKYLGEGFTVKASNGHIRDLPKSSIGVDINNNFKPNYITIEGKGEIIGNLRKGAAEADVVYLATDPDREGEAISWHLAAILGIDPEKALRVTFNEITKKAVRAGIADPRTLDIKLVNAYQARRILDRLVGYKLSPFLWYKVKKGLSAGRVQSVAVRLIVDREKEIRDFNSKEYWILNAFFGSNGNDTFSATFFGDKNGKIELNNKADSDKVLKDLKNAIYKISNISDRRKTVKPLPPFITSTLQQEASRRLGLLPSVTMRIAQQLYEGVEIKGVGLTGLITYMRTDSIRVSQDAQTGAKEYILQEFGVKYCPASPPVYKSKSNAQDAHEAIRPADVFLSPKHVRGSLTAQQYSLYKLIWDRFVASQMMPAQIDVFDYQISAADYIFKTQEQKTIFAGFTVLYTEFNEDDENNEKSKFPPLSVGDVLDFKEIISEQKFTQPPPRYNDATLIKALEEKGIGRPSTYAPIISTIIDREYVEKEKKFLKPTPLGEVVTGLMMDHFKEIVDIKFTAKMEQNLDEVEEGKKDWIKLLEEYYKPFEATLKEADIKLKDVKIKVPEEESDEKCELCGKTMVVKHGRNGKFLACPGYPACKNTKSITKDTESLCPLCGAKVLAKKSKTGRVYFGCEKNPSCKFMTWDIPQKETCPKCGSSLFKVKTKNGIVHCLKENCGFEKASV